MEVADQVVVAVFLEADHVLVQKGAELEVGQDVLDGLCGRQLFHDVFLAGILQEQAVKATIEAICCAFGAVLDQVEVEVDKERVQERHHFVAMLGI